MPIFSQTLPAILIASLLAACDLPQEIESPQHLDLAPSLSAASALAEGQRLWTESCPVPSENGLCVEFQAASAVERCGDSTERRVKVLARDAQKVAAAKDLLERAVTVALAADPNDRAARQDGAQAQILLGDMHFEKVVATTFPEGLDFSEANLPLKKESVARFKAYTREVTEQTKLAVDRYRAARELDPVVGLTGVARAAQVYERWAHEIGHGMIPVDVSKYPDTKQVYCDVLAEQAARLLAHADEARTECHQAWSGLGTEVRGADPCQTTFEIASELAVLRAASAD